MKMIKYRKWIKSLDQIEQIDDVTYRIKLDVHLRDVEFYVALNDKFDDTVVIVKLSDQKITGLNKSSVITDFTKQYELNHKILVVEEVSTKINEQVYSDCNFEVFSEYFFMINLVDYFCSPQYEILSKTETEEFLESYQVKKHKMNKIFITDPAAKYLYLHKGQVIRIIRNSALTGTSIGYRIADDKG